MTLRENAEVAIFGAGLFVMLAGVALAANLLG